MIIAEAVAPFMVYWLILHAPGNHEISVNAKRITSMRAGEGGTKNKVLIGDVHCVIAMDDGKLVNVTETCEEVRRMINEIGRKPTEFKP